MHRLMLGRDSAGGANRRGLNEVQLMHWLRVLKMGCRKTLLHVVRHPLVSGQCSARLSYGDSL